MASVPLLIRLDHKKGNTLVIECGSEKIGELSAVELLDICRTKTKNKRLQAIIDGKKRIGAQFGPPLRLIQGDPCDVDRPREDADEAEAANEQVDLRKGGASLRQIQKDERVFTPNRDIGRVAQIGDGLFIFCGLFRNTDRGQHFGKKVQKNILSNWFRVLVQPTVSGFSNDVICVRKQCFQVRLLPLSGDAVEDDQHNSSMAAKGSFEIKLEAVTKKYDVEAEKQRLSRYMVKSGNVEAGAEVEQTREKLVSLGRDVYEVVRKFNKRFPMIPIEKSVKLHPFGEIYLESFVFQEASAAIEAVGLKPFLLTTTDADSASGSTGGKRKGKKGSKEARPVIPVATANSESASMRDDAKMSSASTGQRANVQTTSSATAEASRAQTSSSPPKAEGDSSNVKSLTSENLGKVNDLLARAPLIGSFLGTKDGKDNDQEERGGVAMEEITIESSGDLRNDAGGVQMFDMAGDDDTVYGDGDFDDAKSDTANWWIRDDFWENASDAGFVSACDEEMANRMNDFDSSDDESPKSAKEVEESVEKGDSVSTRENVGGFRAITKAETEQETTESLKKKKGRRKFA